MTCPNCKCPTCRAAAVNAVLGKIVSRETNDGSSVDAVNARLLQQARDQSAWGDVRDTVGEDAR